MAKTFLDKMKEGQENQFVGRTEYIEAFVNNLDSSSPCTFFSIYGQGGVGKSYLSKKLIARANEKNCLTAYTDESVKSLLEWMDLVSEQFYTKKAELTEFDKRYKVYLQETKKLEADPEKPKGTIRSFTKALMKGVIKEVKKLPGAEIAGAFIDEDNLAGMVSEWADFASKKIGNKDEVELVLDPLKVLTPLFWGDITRHAAGRKSVCFFIDTFEQTDKVVEDWLLSVLHGDYGDFVPYNVMFIIAGREQLNPNKWSEFSPYTQTISLEPFTDAEANDYLVFNHITDPDVQKNILDLSGKLPILMSWLMEAAKNSTIVTNDFCENAVQRFLKWIDEPDKQEIAKVCAIPRLINLDIVKALIDDKTKAPALFEWLLTQPFVQKKGNYWVYHTVVRSQFIKFDRTYSNQDWRSYHRQLRDCYTGWQTSLNLNASEQLNHKIWLQYELERLYHALCADPDQCIRSTISDMVNTWYEKGIDYSYDWAETLIQAGIDNNHQACQEWGYAIRNSINEYYKSNPSVMQNLIGNIIQKGFVKGEKENSILYYMLGIIYSSKREYDKAIECYNKAIAIKPDFSDVYNSMGIVYYNQGNHDKAIECYQKAAELKPGSSDAFYNLGLAYSAKGENESSIVYYLKAAEIRPDFADTFYNLGIAYAANKDNDKAIEYYWKAVDIMPDYAEAYNNLGVMYYTKALDDQAIACYKKTIEIKPDHARAYHNMGLAYYAKGEKQNAIAAYLKAVELQPDYIEAYYKLATAYASAGENDKAITYYLKTIELKPDYTSAYNDIGVIYYNSANYAEAVTYYQKTINLQPDYVDAYYNIALAYTVLGERDKAIESYQKNLELSPGDTGAMYNAAALYIEKGELEKAQELLQRYMEAGKEDQGNLLLGNICLLKGDTPTALAHYQKSLEAYSNKDDFWKAAENNYPLIKDHGISLEYYNQLLDSMKV